MSLLPIGNSDRGVTWHSAQRRCARISRRRWCPRLVIMVKAPELGRVKTRLGGDIGSVGATRFFRSTSRHVIGRLARDQRWETILAVAPDRALGSPVWPAGVRQIAQGHGDLGARMWGVAQLAEHGPVLIVGTDIPGLNPGSIAKAFRALARGDAVVGPAGDGGYWCIGFSRLRRMTSPFADVRWSGPHAMDDTIAGFGIAGTPGCQRVAQAGVLEDVDDGQEFRQFGHLGSRRILPKL